MPVLGTKSYVEWPKWDDRRVKGLGDVQLNDIVVFNYPSGDTVALNVQNEYDYYALSYLIGEQYYAQAYGKGVSPRLDTLDRQSQRNWYELYYKLGSEYIKQNSKEYGEVTARPVDRRENYVKRAVGLPGRTLEIKDRVIYLDGKAHKQLDEVQFNYNLVLKENNLPQSLIKELEISLDDYSIFKQTGMIPLTRKSYSEFNKRT